MKRFAICALAMGLACVAAAAPAFAADKEKKDRLTLRAQRAGWIMGMYIGQEDSHPFPFVLKVDPEGDAKKRGVRPGDELIRFDGLEADPLWRVFERAQELRPGKEVQLWFRRGVQTIRVSLRVPKEAGPATEEESAEKRKEKPAEDEKSADGKKKKKKKEPPVVIKPIPKPGEPE
jgi:predicted metalloprotease with PDZ domain